MKILLTGTAGFIGYHLVRVLCGKGHEVLGFDSINDYYDPDLKYARLADTGIRKNEIKEGAEIQSDLFPDYRLVKGRLEDIQLLKRIFASFRPDIVINLAAQAGVRYSLTNPDAYIDANITGFLNILESCRAYPVKHLVYASSSSVYGLHKSMPFSVNDNAEHPVSLYAASKKSNELMAHTYSHLFGIPTTGLRFFTVYGPWGRPDMALFIFTRAILRGEPIEVFNHGNMERDFTYIDDITGGISRIVESPPPSSNQLWDPVKADPATSSAPYRIYNIGNNNPVKLLDFIRAIENETGKKALMELKDIQAGDVEKTWANVDGLVRDFGYSPGISVKTGIASFVSWYRNYYKI